jgi:glycosyltransferase involved in cell wall biosynthesis
MNKNDIESIRSKYEFIFTIITPTYNRANLLPRAYKSIVKQTFQGFEWIVIDDGSDDQTSTLIEKWQKEAKFQIHYFWQENSGKHNALNKGVSEAKGYFILVLDSDDWLENNCLKRLVERWNGLTVDQKDRCVGIVGLCAYSDGRIVGSPYKSDGIIIDSFELRMLHHIKGDKFGINKTEVMRRFPFPDNLGRFVTESLVWNRIAKEYKQLCVNDILAYKEYQKGGLTNRSRYNRVCSSLSAIQYYSEALRLATERNYPQYRSLRNYINYIRFSLHAKKKIGSLNFCLAIKVCAFTGGFIFFLYDNFKLKNLCTRQKQLTP